MRGVGHRSTSNRIDDCSKEGPLSRYPIIEAGYALGEAKQPAERVLPAAILDTGDFVIESLR